MLSTVGPKALSKALRPVRGTTPKRVLTSTLRMHARSVVGSVEASPQPRAVVALYQAAAEALLELGGYNPVVPDCSIIPAAIGSELQA